MKGMSLYDGLQELFERYGWYHESLRSLTMTGKKGAQQIAELFDGFRKHPWKEIAGVAVVEIEDYVTGKRHHLASDTKEIISLPQSDVLKYKLINDQWICIRPSGRSEEHTSELHSRFDLVCSLMLEKKKKK